MRQEFWAWLLIATCVLSAASSLFVAWYWMRVTGGAVSTGQVSLCIDIAPQLIVPCNTSLRQNVSFTCQLLVQDPDNDTWVFDAAWLTNRTVFTLSASGLISFTPQQNDTGNHSVNFTVDDQRNCTGSRDSEVYSFNVSDINDPPELVQRLPNTDVVEQRLVSAFFLNDYFSDPDGDAMTFTSSLTQFINVTIRSSSQVVVTGSSCPTTEYVIFTATDTKNAQGDSNVVALACEELATTSEAAAEEEEEEKSTLRREELTPSCQPNVECGGWSACGPDGLQSKHCRDAAGCRTGDITITRTCVYEANCFNGYKDALEVGLDCGGPCPPCPSCSDGLLNQDETDVDCGGGCGPCRASRLLYAVQEGGQWSVRYADFLQKSDITVLTSDTPGGGAWNRNGTRFAYGGGGAIWLAEAGAEPEELVPGRPFPLEWPSWSRKGPLVYVARSPVTTVLHWLDPETHRDRVLAPSLPAKTPAIAPDASRIALATGDFDFGSVKTLLTGAAVSDRSELFLIDEEGQVVQKISDPHASLYAPSFSADGKSLVYFAREGDTSDLWILDLTTQERRRLTQTQENEVFPVWSDDNLRIMFSADYEGNYDLYTINPDGTSLDKVADVSLITIPYDWYTHPTCFDGERDQNETGVDCGGPCAPCTSCYDGEKNGLETGIDCGGPCAPCYVEIPQPFSAARTLLINVGLLSGLGLFLWVLFRLFRPRLLRRWHRVLVKAGRRRKKLVLLDAAAKDHLLGRLSDLERRVEAGVLTGADLSGSLGDAARDFFAAVSKDPARLTPAEFAAWVAKQPIYPELRAILTSFLSKVYKVEVGAAGTSEPEQILLLEELRTLIFLTAAVTKKDITREVREVHPEAFLGEMDRAHALLTEAVIALGFGELQAALRKYVAARLSSLRLKIQNRASLNADLARIYKEILYAEALARSEEVR